MLLYLRVSDYDAIISNKSQVGSLDQGGSYKSLAIYNVFP